MTPEAYPYLLGAMGLLVAATGMLYNSDDDERVKAFIIAECAVGLRYSIGMWLLIELMAAATAHLP